MTKFSDLKLGPKVLKAIADAGYETPTPIQQGAIPPAMEGRDVLGIAQTGTGKTASFTLPMITRLERGRARARMPRSLVLCPTRELAAQVAENFDTYARYSRLTKALLIGGVSFKEQDLAIDKGVDVLIATPGRLLDHFERGKLLLTGVQIMVVDEADRMLDMGFIPDIERIFQLTPFTRQTLFFSATMAPEIERITNTFLSNPARIEVARQATAAESIAQRVVPFEPSRRDRAPSEKRALLRRIIDAEGAACTNAIIFCNRKTEVDALSKSLQKYGYDAAPIHGDLEQSQRTRTLDAFRDGRLRFLVASDVAARGLDIPAVSHVFNFDVPSHPEDYVHRIGRTGRAGRDGTAVMIAGPLDDKYMSAVEALLGRQVPRSPAPPMPAEDDGRPRRPRGEGSARSAAPAEAAAPAAETAPPPRAETARSRPARERTGRPAAGRQPSAEPRIEVKAEARPEPQTEVRPEPRPEAPAAVRTERAQAPRREAEPGSPAGAGHRSGHGAGHGGRPGRERVRDEGPQVVGMGDHLPSFIALSFAQRRPE